MKENDFITLDEHLCFSLYACSRAIFRLYRPYLDELHLTYPQYLVLLVLWERQESTVKELGELLGLDSGTLTPMLKRMEAAELVERRRSVEDERVVMILITEAGSLLKEKSMCIPKSLLESTGMTENEVITINNVIKKLLQKVNKAESAK